MHFLRLLFWGLILFGAITGTAYYIATPGEQILIAFLSGVCHGIIVIKIVGWD